MNNEIIKPTEQNPQGYGPSKPVILDLARQAESLSQLSAAEGNAQGDFFQYLQPGKTRFIGVEVKAPQEEPAFGNAEGRGQKMLELLTPYKGRLDSLQTEYGSVITDLCYINHSRNEELGTDERLMLGYFYQEGTPVPEGLSYIDIFTETVGYGMYCTENVVEDEEMAYVTTRDRILHDGNSVPYPVGYWTAMVFTHGLPHQGKYCFGYMFPALIKQH